MSSSLQSVQSGNIRMEAVVESKLLNFNMDKSNLIVLGNKRNRCAIMEALVEKPVTLCGQNMKVVETYTYLGDQISGLGLNESVMATILKRKGLVCKSIREIRSMIDDCRVNVVGGICAGIQVWELAVIPYLLNNCDTWTYMYVWKSNTDSK